MKSLLQYIREREMPIKVIMRSARDDRETVMNCIVTGAAGYIAKSSGDEKVFERALATVFREGIFLPASILRATARPQWLRWPTPNTDLAQLGLSPRLAEVLYSLYQRLSNEHIASWMGISEGTVRKNYVSVRCVSST